MAAKKKNSKGTGKGMTKAGFIRGLPESTPADEVISKAKDAGLELTKKLVWNTQSEMRTGAKGGTPKKPGRKAAAPGAPAKTAEPSSVKTTIAAKPKGKGQKKAAKTKPAAKPTFAVTAPSASASISSAEQKMKALIVQLGTTRAEQILRALKSQLDLLAGGA